MTDESSRELSLFDLDSEYRLVESSGSVIESEKESVPTKRMRHFEEQQAISSSTIHHPGEVVCTSNAVHLHERPGSSGVSLQPQGVWDHTSVPKACENPLWLTSDSAAASIHLFKMQSGRHQKCYDKYSKVLCSPYMHKYCTLVIKIKCEKHM